jgi:deoxyribose-phosphate aldolase
MLERILQDDANPKQQDRESMTELLKFYKKQCNDVHGKDVIFSANLLKEKDAADIRMDIIKKAKTQFLSKSAGVDQVSSCSSCLLFYAAVSLFCMFNVCPFF